MGKPYRWIKHGWERYEKLAVPAGASDLQRKETRQAFYAGAAVLFQTLMTALDPGAEETPEDMTRMLDLQAEVDEFGQELDAAVLGKIGKRK